MDGRIVNLNAAKSTRRAGPSKNTPERPRARLLPANDLAAAEQAQRVTPSSPSVTVNSELEIKSSLPSRTLAVIGSEAQWWQHRPVRA